MKNYELCLLLIVAGVAVTGLLTLTTFSFSLTGAATADGSSHSFLYNIIAWIFGEQSLTFSDGTTYNYYGEEPLWIELTDGTKLVKTEQGWLNIDTQQYVTQYIEFSDSIIFPYSGEMPQWREEGNKKLILTEYGWYDLETGKYEVE